MKKSVHRYSAIFMAGIFSASISFAEGEDQSEGSAAASSGISDKLSAAANAIGQKFGFIDPAKKAAEEKEQKSPGLENVKQKILSDVESMKKFVDLGNIVDPGMAKIQKGGQQYFEHQSDCVSRQNTAAKWCLETLSPNITDIVTGLNTMMSAVGGSSVNNSCSTFAKAMDLAKAGMTAYTAACGTTKAGCGYACVKARKGIEQVQEGLKSQISCKVPTSPSCGADIANYQGLQQSALQGVTQELEKANNSSVAGKADLCTGKYAQLAVSAIAGITSIANSLNQGKACDEATSAANVAAQTLEQKCAIETNAKLPECICLKNPMLEGCGSTAVKSTTSAEGFGSFSSSGDKTLGKGNGLTNSDLSTGGAGGEDVGGKGTASAGGVPPPAGGGSAGLGGGSGGGSGSGRDPADDKTGQKGLNTNILSGAGGGGGGGSWGSRGGSDDSGKGYRSYLPGGDKDPNKMAGQQPWAKEVTGQGGKSNWEKVKDRYRDNKSTLLSN
ncbi:MAG: hypothetical protein ACKOX6_06420 [Bdellovibrio sp.]